MGLISSAKSLASSVKSGIEHKIVKARKTSRDLAIVRDPDANPRKVKRAEKRLETRKQEFVETGKELIAKTAGTVTEAAISIPIASQAAGSTVENLTLKAMGGKTENTDENAPVAEELVEDIATGTVAELAGDLTEKIIPVPVLNKAAGKVVSTVTDKVAGYAIDSYQRRSVKAAEANKFLAAA